jgi:hypothetical protein
MGKGSGRRKAQVPESVLLENYERIFREPHVEAEPPAPLPRCEECKHRHDPAVDCDAVTY